MEITASSTCCFRSLDFMCGWKIDLHQKQGQRTKIARFLRKSLYHILRGSTWKAVNRILRPSLKMMHLDLEVSKITPKKCDFSKAVSPKGGGNFFIRVEVNQILETELSPKQECFKNNLNYYQFYAKIFQIRPKILRIQEKSVNSIRKYAFTCIERGFLNFYSRGFVTVSDYKNQCLLTIHIR